MPDNNNVIITLNLKKLLIIGGVISALGGGMYGIAEAAITLDNRYLKVSTFKAIKKVERIEKLEDKIFELNFKVQDGKASSMDKALLDRFKSKLEAEQK